MSSTTAAHDPDATSRSHADRPVLFAVAAAVALVHLLTNGRYGFHRDEWQFLSDASHLDWGFVAYPPVTPFLERVSLSIFGLSMVGLRLFSVLAQSAAIFVSGLMAYELGGRRIAQLATALAVALSPLPLFQGTEFQYSSFDYLWWVLAAYFVIKLLKLEDARWCVAIGGVVGIGLMTKYSIAFFVAGILAGLIFTPARRYLASRWFWIGITLALLLCLPNIVWQARHGFISWHFLQYIHARDIRWGRAKGFFVKQLWICTNLYSVPLWIAGAIGYLRSPRYRMLAFMYLVPLAYFVAAKGIFYYLAPAYPMLIAEGAAMGERWVIGLRPWGRRAVVAVLFTGLAGAGMYGAAIVLPLATGGPLMRFALDQNDTLREEIGWPELVKSVAEIRDKLPQEQRQSLGVLVGNYGEQGAIEMLGPAYHLPLPISMTNSAWLRGYPTPQPSTLIVVGFSQKSADKAFTSCRLAGHNGDAKVLKNEESEWHPDIFVCGPPRLPWAQFWKEYQSFG
jgi:hypothetical protein